MRKCIFCNNDKSITREHIYPSWLFEILSSFKGNTFKPGIHPVILPVSTEHPDKMLADNLSDNREIRYDDFVTRHVCGDCNQGWMSKLESATKSILKDILLSPSKEFYFSSVDSNTLTLWAIKTALLINQASNYTYKFNERIHHMVRHELIPEGFMVESRFLQSIDINYFIGGPVMRKCFVIPEEGMKQAYENFYRIGIQIGRFALRVSYLRTPVSVFRKQIVRRDFSLYPYGIKSPFESMEEIKHEDKIALPLFCIQLVLAD